MGAPMRITWSLLSLSFLFISVCSNTDSQNATGVVVGQNGPSPTDKSKITLSPTTKKPTAAVSAPTMTATSKPHTDGTQVSNVTNNPSTAAASTTAASSTAASAAAASAAAASAAAASTAAASTAAASTAAASTAAAATAAAATAAASTAAAATAAAATAAASTAAASTTAASAAAASTAAASTAAAPTTTSPPKTIRADSSGVSVTLSAPTRLTMNTSGPDDTSGTGAPVGSSGSVGKTEISKVSTGVFTSGQQSVTDTTIATKTSQDSRGTKKTTAVAAVPGWPGSRPTEPAGNPVTTSTPSTLTKAGPNRPPLVPTAGTTQTPTTTTITNTSTTTCTTEPQLKTFLYSLNNGHERREKYLAEVCRCLMVNFEDGNCTLTLKHNPLKIQFAEITGKVKTSLVNQCSENITKIPTANKTLIAILASCGALLIMIVILVVCVSHRRRPYNDNQQHLTEELHTVENGYHDNPTLEVMEVQPEMQEKKVALNGEFNDSWIVPIDNLLKGDVADEEDTHL